MLRQGADKLLYHVDRPAELYKLDDDPFEGENLLRGRGMTPRAKELEALLRENFCDPEAVDARCKADQRDRVAEFGGNQAVRERGIFVRTRAARRRPHRCSKCEPRGWR